MSSDRRREEHDDRLVGLHDRPDDVDGTGTDLLDSSGVHLVEPDSKLSLAKPIVNELLPDGTSRRSAEHRGENGAARSRDAHQLAEPEAGIVQVVEDEGGHNVV